MVKKDLDMRKIVGLLLAAASFAGGLWKTTGQETQKPETLEVHSGSR